MENLGYFLAAFIIVWALVFGYVLWLSARQCKLRQDIKSLCEKARK